jgi:hypothetical protein
MADGLMAEDTKIPEPRKEWFGNFFQPSAFSLQPFNSGGSVGMAPFCVQTKADTFTAIR